MKKTFLITAAFTLLFMPALAQQQGMPSLPPAVQQQLQKLQTMSPEEQAQYMETMMNNMGKMQQCIEDVGGEAAMNELKAKGQEAHAKVKALCDESKRDEAQAAAMAQSKEMLKDERVRKLQACAKEMSDSMPEIKKFLDPDSYFANNHVCDEKGSIQ